MKLIFTCLLSLCFLSGFSQNPSDNLSFETEYKYGTNVIKLNFKNLYYGIKMSNVRFDALIESLGYSFSSSDNIYIANTSVGAPYYTVSKKPNEFQMIWTGDRYFSSFLKDQIQDIYKKEEDGWYFYKVIDTNDKNYGINIMLKEDGDGGMVVMTKVRLN